MNTKRIFIAGIAVTVLWQGVAAADKELRTDSGYRRAFASTHETDVVKLTTVGVGDRTLIFETFPPDVSSCDVTLDAVAQGHVFLDAAAAVGFTEIGCYQFDAQDHIAGSLMRKITPRKPLAPAFERLFTRRDANA